MDKQKILIVDDDPLIISELIGFVREEPYEIFTAENGVKGLEILQKEKIDLAVVEIYVEDMDGITLLKRAKAEKIQTAILIMTDLGTLELGEEVIKASAVSVFDKPIKRGAFLAKVKKYMPPQDMWKASLESFLEDNYRDPELRFEDVVRHFRFSKTYGNKLFRKHLGESFRMCLRNVRLAERLSEIEALKKV